VAKFIVPLHKASKAYLGLEDLIGQRDHIDEEIIDMREELKIAQDSARKTKTVLSLVLDHKTEIDEFYHDIFGFEHEDEDGTARKVSGKRADLDDVYHDLEGQLEVLTTQIKEFETATQTSFDSFIIDNHKVFDATHKKILKLLPSALTAGLSNAYEDKIKSEKKELEALNNSFRNAIKALVCVSSMPFFISVIRLVFLHEDLISIIKDIPSLLAMVLPVYFPILWAAYSANKGAKLSKRLIEEYTHKGVLSKTYEGLTNQINGLKEESSSKDLRIKLLYNLLEVNSENPGKLISNYNNSDHPIMEAIENSSKLSKSLDKLGKIPGLEGIVKRMESTVEQRLVEEGTRIDNVIANTDTDADKSTA